MSIYEVTEQGVSQQSSYDGIIIRDEKVFKTDQAGFINYYATEGDKIGKNQTIYSVDETGEAEKLLAQSEDSKQLSNEDASDIREMINNFKGSYTNSNFSTVTSFKYQVEGTVLQLSNVNKLDEIKKLLKKSGNAGKFSVKKTSESGIVSYSVDGYENLKASAISDAKFKQDKYERTELRTTDEKSSNSPVYKLIRSDNWSIVVPITNDDYKLLKDKKTVNITFLKNRISANASVNIIQNGDKLYAELSLSRYLDQFLNDRFVSIQIRYQSAKGLKIPKTSVMDRKFYRIPLTYFSKSGASGDNGVTVVKYSENGEAKAKFIPATIYKQDKKYGYIDSSLLDAGDILKSPSSGGDFTVGRTSKFKIVYNVNKGYTVFRLVDIIYENEEYYLVSDDTKYGLSTYDHIVTNALTVENKQIINE
ncbi:membrane-fusion protein [Lachnospiraceae bacterium KM106-2]|nr:membrane-fusion protein [Lachnospiraceae bacterium KM106-2]